MKPNEDRKFDVRLIEQRLRAEAVSAEEYKKFLDSLPDDAEHAEPARVNPGAPAARKS